MTRNRRGRLAPICLAAGLAVVAGSTVVGLSSRARPVDRGVVPGAAAPPGTAAPGTRPGVTAAVQRVGSLPTGIDIGRLAVHAPVVPVAVLAGGALVVPADIHTVGWWSGGGLPGAAGGTVVLDGHVDSASAGDGALFDLAHLSVGTTVVITGTPSDVRYRITGLREYDKGDLPVTSLFAQTSTPRLVLITCGGPFDATTRHYRDNIVAFGVPVTP